jgi:PPIC-type PPIASE domain
VSRRLASAALAALACLCLACRRDGAAAAPAAHDANASLAQAAQPVGYPQGPWWRADISGVLVGVAHILITHARSAPTDGVLSLAGPRSSRSEGEALELAQRVSALCAAAPDRFGELVQEYSEDLATRPLAGRIGTVYAMQLPKAVVDALGNLKVGEVSRVVQTDLGYHVIRRLTVAPEQTVAGAEIQIHHRDSVALTAPGRERGRTRAEARALALEVWRQLRAEPDRFAQFVAQHSDAWSRVNDGALGDWSTYTAPEESPDVIGLSVLAGLEPGQISIVLEDQRGFRILKRTAVDGRLFAFSSFMIAHAMPAEPWADPSIVRSQADAARLAADALAHLRKKPGDFAEYRARHCDYAFCALEPVARPPFRNGYGGLDRQLAANPVGTVLPELIAAPGGFLIVKREDERAFMRPPREVSFELPRPTPENYATATGPQLLWFGARFKERALHELELSSDDKRQLSEKIDAAFAAIAAAEPQARPDTLAEFYRTVEGQFGQPVGNALRQVLDRASVELQGQTLDDPR